MGDMGDAYRAMREERQERRERNRQRHEEESRDDGIDWKKHTIWHWQTMLLGHRLDFWPTKNKWRWRGRNYHGNVRKFMKARIKKEGENNAEDTSTTEGVR